MTRVEHSHCPYDCDHPQPFRAVAVDDNWDDEPIEREYCGRCWHQDGELVVMIPCTPETCT